jgi:hypothetical protein
MIVAAITVAAMALPTTITAAAVVAAAAANPSQRTLKDI